MDSTNSNHKHLVGMTKQELINYIIRLETTPPINSKAKRARLHQHRVAQITSTRPIALLVMYFGWNYAGMAKQGLGDTDMSVEHQIVCALTKVGLADPDCAIQRCGRTDKGVSAISQVVSLHVRSNLQSDSQRREFNYTSMLNSVLPADIRVLAWSPVSDTFNARHSCKNRTYVYNFPPNGFNVEEMNKGAQLLVGTHDFANFCCKSDQENQSTTRTVLKADVTHLEDQPFAEFKVKATGFLYHQVRMFIHCLLLVGRGLEDLSLISRLLNTDQVPERPSYGPAPAFPLVFFDATYGEEDLDWVYDSNTLEKVHSLLYRERISQQTKAAVVALAEGRVKQWVENAQSVEDKSITRMFVNTTGKSYKNMIK